MSVITAAVGGCQPAATGAPRAIAGCVYSPMAQHAALSPPAMMERSAAVPVRRRRCSIAHGRPISLHIGRYLSERRDGCWCRAERLRAGPGSMCGVRTDTRRQRRVLKDREQSQTRRILGRTSGAWEYKSVASGSAVSGRWSVVGAVGSNPSLRVRRRSSARGHGRTTRRCPNCIGRAFESGS